MTHESESSLEDRIESLLARRYGPENVARQYIYPATQRRVDLLVDVGFCHVAIECESRASELINGVGQALHYAAHDLQGRTMPCVVVADDHVLDDPERDRLEQNAMIYTESELRGELSLDSEEDTE